MATDPRDQYQPPGGKLRLGGALQIERRRLGLSREQVADQMSWRTSKVKRLEWGMADFGSEEVRRLLRVYGVEDAERIRQFEELAELEDRHWTMYSDIFSHDALTLFANESAAGRVLKFEPTYLPAHLQTESYSRSLLTALGVGRAEIERRIEVIASRRERLRVPGYPQFKVVLGEAVLSRPVGGNAVMTEQIERLKSVAEIPGFDIYMLPFSAGAVPGMGRAFTILQFDDERIADLLFREDAGRRSQAVERETTVAEYRDRFQHLLEVSISPPHSVRTIEALVRQAG